MGSSWLGLEKGWSRVARSGISGPSVWGVRRLSGYETVQQALALHLPDLSEDFFLLNKYPETSPYLESE